MSIQNDKGTLIEDSIRESSLGDGVIANYDLEDSYQATVYAPSKEDLPQETEFSWGTGGYSKTIAPDE